LNYHPFHHPATAARNSLTRVFSELSEAEAVAVYDVLARWADAERDGLERRQASHPNEPLPADRALVLAEGVVSKFQAEFVANGRQFWDPKTG
jgi:hypothetical protein